MVSILQALKYTAFYFIPLTASFGAMLLSIFIANPTQVTDGITFDTQYIPFVWLIVIFVGSAFVFIVFLFKGIGDITEAALIE